MTTLCPKSMIQLEKNSKEVTFSVIIVVGIISRRVFETIVFSCTLYILRQQIGGWHAPSTFLCTITSIGCVVVSVCIIGPSIEHLNAGVLFSLCLTTGLLLLVSEPRFSKNLHLSQEETHQIAVEKQHVVLLLLCVQLLCLIIYKKILVYSLLGQITALLGWILQKE